MELSDLAIFKAVVDHGGIIAAAQSLHRVPSNVSSRIRQLERSTGAALFFRERRRLKLTPVGQKLVPFAERLLGLAAEAQASLSGLPQGLIRLGALESTAASRLPALLAQLHRRSSYVRIELSTGTNDALTTAVAEGRVDAAFVAERPKGPQFLCMPAYTERLILITSLQHPAVTSARDVSGTPLIAFPRGCAYRRALERWLGRTNVGPRFELSSYHAIVACVASGTGVAVVPESVLETLDASMVRRHSLPGVHADRMTYLISLREAGNAAVGALFEELQKQRLRIRREARAS